MFLFIFLFLLFHSTLWQSSLQSSGVRVRKGRVYFGFTLSLRIESFTSPWAHEIKRINISFLISVNDPMADLILLLIFSFSFLGSVLQSKLTVAIRMLFCWLINEFKTISNVLNPVPLVTS